LSVDVVQPERLAVAQTRLAGFRRYLEQASGCRFADHAALDRFCVQEFRQFWRAFLCWSELQVDGRVDPVCVGDICEHARFFPNLRLNYAESLLADGVGFGDDAPAVTACTAEGQRRLTRGELRRAVLDAAAGLAALGLRPGDPVVAIARNSLETVIAVLAATALGAVVSTSAPEIGAEAILARFAPLSPRLLLAHVLPQPHDTGVSLPERVARVAGGLTTLLGVVTLDDGPAGLDAALPVHPLRTLPAQARQAVPLDRFPFNHPLFVVFSSGTTGEPKCIVHGAGGTLLEHVKEHRLHGDLGPGDRLFFQTSCAWMMWNWQLSALASGVEIVLYDGPIESARTLWEIVERERVTVFGTSPAYLKFCEDAGLEPQREFDLADLRAIQSTGSVLFDRQYDWVRDHVGPMPLQSISGGTDILGCFVLGNPDLPVHPGESQCRSLGLDVRAAPLRDGALAAAELSQGEFGCSGIGELICANPFPSRPLGLFGDPDGSRFHAAYFAANPGVWTHGDLIEFTPRGGARLHGRSDGVLNVRGIRIGPAEIYAVLQEFSEIAEAMAVEQRLGGQSGESRMVLLLVLRPGAVLDGALVGRVRRELARRASTAHVPDAIVAVAALPVTHTGKRSEAAASDAVNGRPVRNPGGLRNPECLEALRCHPALRARPALPTECSAAELETLLQELWERLFGFAPIEPQDDFFELGGHSLLAARMFTEIKRATGRELPLSTLLHAPTLEQLALVIRDRSWSPSSRLIRLRAGEGGPPLFMVHSAAGTVMQLRPLARALACDRPVYGIQPHGLDPDQEPHRRIEDMAADYLAIMRAVQPHGPYAIAGFSFGGLVAFEMAQRLARDGETVQPLALIDTAFHPRYMPRPEWLRVQAARAVHQLRSVRALPRGGRRAYLAGRVAIAAERARVRLGLAPDRAADARHPVEFPAPLRRVRDAIVAANAAYRPRPYPGPVTYLRAQTRDKLLFDPLSRWHRLAGAGLQVHPVPGDHDGMIVPPNVTALGAVLAAVLQNAERAV